MANLTIVVDKQVLKRARIKAIGDGTSVNAVLRDYLERYANGSQAEAALASFAELARRSSAGSGPGGRTWSREEIHDRSTLR